MKRRKMRCVACGREKWTTLKNPKCTRKGCQGVLYEVNGQTSLIEFELVKDKEVSEPW